MGRRRTTPVVTVAQFWDALTADYGAAGTYALAVEDIITAIVSGVYGLSALNDDLDALLPGLAARRLNFYDEFNRTVEDTDVWTSGGDDGSFAFTMGAGVPTEWYMNTGATTDNDRYIHGTGTIYAKFFSLDEVGYGTITATFRIRLPSIADISVLVGLFQSVPSDYAEPGSDCAQFLIDPTITNTFRARSFDAAEEETDTLIGLDTDPHKLTMVITAASVLFYIDDVLVATHATQVPKTNMQLALLVRTEADAVKQLFIDSVHVEVT